MKKARDIFIFVAGACFVLAFLMMIATPDKTDAGQFTNPIKYWTCNQYFIDNFSK